jgi:hypothetical protein
MVMRLVVVDLVDWHGRVDDVWFNRLCEVVS